MIHALKLRQRKIEHHWVNWPHDSRNWDFLYYKQGQRKQMKRQKHISFKFEINVIVNLKPNQILALFNPKQI